MPAESFYIGEVADEVDEAVLQAPPRLESPPRRRKPGKGCGAGKLLEVLDKAAVQSAVLPPDAAAKKLETRFLELETRFLELETRCLELTAAKEEPTPLELVQGFL